MKIRMHQLTIDKKNPYYFLMLYGWKRSVNGEVFDELSGEYCLLSIDEKRLSHGEYIVYSNHVIYEKLLE